MKPIASLLGKSRRLWLVAAGVIGVTGTFLDTAVAVAQANLPTVAAIPMDIGQCRAPTSHQRTTRILSCSCPAQASDPNHSGGVWGTDVYTADSYICKAARHAGALGPGGGQVTLQMLPGQSSYRGSARNGETTRAYGRYGGSYRFVTLAGTPAAVTAHP